MATSDKYEQKLVFMHNELRQMGKENISAGEKVLDFLIENGPSIFSAAISLPATAAELINFGKDGAFDLGNAMARFRNYGLDTAISQAKDKLQEAVVKQVENATLEGCGVFDANKLPLTEDEKNSLKSQYVKENDSVKLKKENARYIIKKIAQVGFIVIGGLIAGTSPVGWAVAGFILLGAGFKATIVAERVSRMERWEKITNSMMKKYAVILAKAKEKKDNEVAKELAAENNAIDEEWDKGNTVVGKTSQGRRVNRDDMHNLFEYAQEYLKCNVQVEGLDPVQLQRTVQAFYNLRASISMWVEVRDQPGLADWQVKEKWEKGETYVVKTFKELSDMVRYQQKVYLLKQCKATDLSKEKTDEWEKAAVAKEGGAQKVKVFQTARSQANAVVEYKDELVEEEEKLISSRPPVATLAPDSTTKWKTMGSVNGVKK